MSLKRHIGTASMLAAALTGIIGSGWLFGPFYAAKAAGPSAVLAWVIGGVLMMVVALNFVELACLFPKAGSIVHFTRLSHGPIASLLFGWVAWLSCITVPPIETLALLQYTSNYLPNLMHKVGNDMILTHWGLLTAGALLFLLCLINRFGVKLATQANNFIVTLKIAVPIATIVLLTYHGLDFGPMRAVTHWNPSDIKDILIALPTAGIVFSFIGYNTAIQMAGEAKDPQRSLPLAIIGALLIGILFYALIQIVFLGSLHTSMLANGWSHLSFNGDAGPFAGLLTAIGLTWFAVVLYADALISPYGTAFIYTLSAARINFALAHNNQMPSSFKTLNRHHVPWKAMLFNFICGLLLIVPFPGWQHLVGFLISAFVLVYSIAPLSLATLRQSHPDIARTFSLPHANLLSPLAFFICNLLLYWTGWHTLSKLLVLIATGAILVGLLQTIKRSWFTRTDLKRVAWLPFFLLGTGVISYLGSFDGIKVIHFGWDFLVIAIFSGLVFYWAQRCAKASD